MGIPSEMRDIWIKHREALVIASPAEEQKVLRARNCTQGYILPILIRSIRGSMLLFNYVVCFQCLSRFF